MKEPDFLRNSAGMVIYPLLSTRTIISEISQISSKGIDHLSRSSFATVVSFVFKNTPAHYSYNPIFTLYFSRSSSKLTSLPRTRRYQCSQPLQGAFFM